MRGITMASSGNLVSLAAVFSIVTQRWGGALRDDTKNGSEGDYRKLRM